MGAVASGELADRIHVHLSTRSIHMSLFWVWFWLMVSNVTYQFFGPLHWGDAFERSYFQAIAIIGVWFVAKMQALQQQAKP